MKKKDIICLCAASLLVINCASAPCAFAADYSFIQKMEPLLYDTEFQAELEAEQYVQEGVPDTRWFDPEDQRQEYEITTEEQLMGLAQLVNNREFRWDSAGFHTFEGITIRLMNDIKLTQDWTPIGISDTLAFKGIFDGNGHNISVLRIDSASERQGFCGYLKGTVENLTLQGVVQTRRNYAAGLAAYMTSSAVVKDCTVKVNVSGKDKVGGIAGENYSGLIIGCCSQGTVEGSAKVGGIAGENWNGRIKKCGNEGDVISYETGVGTYGTGGIAGRSVAAQALIEDCFNKGNISSENECAGGIAGYANAHNSAIESCYNTGVVSGSAQASSGYTGGIVGKMGSNVKLKNTYNTGPVKNSKYTGGMIGSYTADTEQDFESFVSNNYYLDGTAALAIGAEENTKGSRNYDEAIHTKSSADLRSTHMARVLGSAYRSDTGGMHGINNGFPVFKWQEAASVSKDELLQKMKIPYKEEFRSFFSNHPDGAPAGNLLLKAFNPQLLFEEISSSIRERKEEQSKSNTINNRK